MTFGVSQLGKSSKRNNASEKQGEVFGEFDFMLPETNMAPEKNPPGSLEIPNLEAIFRCELLVLGRVVSSRVLGCGFIKKK